MDGAGTWCSQNKLAERVGISTGCFSQLMSGRRSPSAEVREGLMEALGVMDFEELFILELVSSSIPEAMPVAIAAPAFDAGPGGAATRLSGGTPSTTRSCADRPPGRYPGGNQAASRRS